MFVSLVSVVSDVSDTADEFENDSTLQPLGGDKSGPYKGNEPVQDNSPAVSVSLVSDVSDVSNMSNVSNVSDISPGYEIMNFTNSLG